MSPLEWKESSKSDHKNASKERSDPWFGFALLLVGVIAGFLAASNF